MATTKTCDVCGRPTKVIAGKLLFVPTTGSTKERTHSHYTHHADVGDCCKDRILKLGFRKRMTRKEYMESRKN